MFEFIIPLTDDGRCRETGGMYTIKYPYSAPRPDVKVQSSAVFYKSINLAHTVSAFEGIGGGGSQCK
jgi:hypothetical protein